MTNANTPANTPDENTAPPQSEAGIDRAGTGRAGSPDSARRPNPAAPSSQRPGDEEGPTTGDGSQAPPDPADGAV
jgi:hypothetical protein